MYRCVHSGFDSLDVSYQGAIPTETLAYLKGAKEEAQISKRDQAISFGPGPFEGFIKGHGMSGGYAFVLTNGPTGGIFSIMENSNPRNWNLAVSVRALRLLTHGYKTTRQWIGDTLEAMGCDLRDHSVRRIDYAVDILAPGFDLQMNNFVAPAQSKVIPYWSGEQKLDDYGNRPMAVVRGREFESVTIGKMPGRQITVYNKTKACIDQKQPYWHEAWGLDKDDPEARVFRTEIRAGRDAIAKRLIKRSYDAVEGDIQSFIQKSLRDIRYVSEKGTHKNISRAPNHELWDIAWNATEGIPFDPTPAIPELRALEIMRKQRIDMNLKQGFGCLINTAILNGSAPDDIASDFSSEMSVLVDKYLREHDRRTLLNKAESTYQRSASLTRHIKNQ